MYGFCPQCNSDAPEVYDCFVCSKYICDDGTILDNRVVKTYPVNEATKEEWFKEWQFWNGIS